ncbi:MAG: hypothetical protein KDE20_09715 [Caldilineaceae bacterium]|nr:hypothetical protein [Caldilineaceae bacterium]
MALKASKQAILVDEFIFNCDTSAVETTIDVAELPTNNLCDGDDDAYVPGLRTWRITQTGYFDGVDADGIEKELYDRLGVTGAQVSHVINRTVTNDVVHTLPDAFNAELPISAVTAEIITMNGAWAAVDSGYRGRLVSYNTTISATGNGTSIDLGSAGSAGGYFFLHVHQIDDDTSGTSTDSVIKMQSSSDDSTFADEATITFSATGGYSATMSGTVNRYIRISTTDLGGATTLEVTAIVYVANVT